MKVFCEFCGNIINDAEKILSRFGNPPKKCQACRSEQRSYRKEGIVSRQCLQEWDGVKIYDLSFIEKLERQEAQKSRYWNYRFGGREFGSNWAGAGFDNQYPVFVQRDLNHSKPCKIRLMEKLWRKEEKLHRNEYLVIEQSETEFQQELYWFENYHKTTLKGYGRDRNVSHSVEGEHEIVLEAATWARSGRFGNKTVLIVGKNLIIEKEGQE